MTSERNPDERWLKRVRWLSPQAWNWAKAQALREDRTAGDLLNGLIREYRCEIQRSPVLLPGSHYFDRSRDAISVRGLDRELWSWLVAQAEVSGKPAGRILTELICRYERRVSVLRFGDG